MLFRPKLPQRDVLAVCVFHVTVPFSRLIPPRLAGSSRPFFVSFSRASPIVLRKTPRGKKPARSIKKKADRIRLARVPLRAYRASRYEIPIIARTFPQARPEKLGIKRVDARGWCGSGAPPLEKPARHNEQKNAPRPTGINDAPLSAVIEKPPYPSGILGRFFRRDIRDSFSQHFCSQPPARSSRRTSRFQIATGETPTGSEHRV